MNVRTASWATVVAVLVICAVPMAGTAVASVGEDHKVTICHVPPGNPENAQSIEVDRESWSGHRNHKDDYEGPCQPVTTTSTSTSTTSTSTTTTEPVTTSTSTTVDTTTTTSTTVPETTTTTVAPTTTTTTTVPATTTTVAPTTTSTTAPPPSVSPETTVREQPEPVIGSPATTERVPAPQVKDEELAFTGLPYDVATLVLGGLIVVLLGVLLVRCSRRDDD